MKLRWKQVDSTGKGDVFITDYYNRNYILQSLENVIENDIVIEKWVTVPVDMLEDEE